MKKLFLLSAITVLISACGDDQKTLATVNGKKIYEQEFNAYLTYKRSSARSEEDKQKLLDAYLQREAIAAQIEQAVLPNDKLLQAELNELRKDVLINRHLDRHVNKAVTEEAINNYYNINSAKYEEKKVHVAHILLRLNRNMDESQRQVKRTTIQEAYSKLQTGMDFAEAAQQYSEDANSAKKGGDLGWLPEGAIHQNFSQVAFSTEAEKFSEVIETPYGFHIIKVLEAPKTSRKSFESVKGEIRYQLRNAAKESERKRLLDQVKISQG